MVSHFGLHKYNVCFDPQSLWEAMSAADTVSKRQGGVAAPPLTQKIHPKERGGSTLRFIHVTM